MSLRRFSNFAGLTDEMRTNFNEQGYILVEKIFSDKEVDIINDCFAKKPYEGANYGIDDGEKKKVIMFLWNQPGHPDAVGLLGRLEKIVKTCEELLGDEVYFYHGKHLQKPAKIGGKFQWHQDYGYWYYNGCLRPDMMTIFIALDDIDAENGCLRIVPSSHLLGRIDHREFGGQMQADPKRLEYLFKEGGFKEQNVVLKRGDAIFFHCNVLHTSSPNNSERRRNAVALSYNTKRNNPTVKHHHPFYTPLLKVPNNSLLTCTVEANVDGKEMLLQSAIHAETPPTGESK